MRMFACHNCNNLLYFENVQCTVCGATLGFLPDQLRLVALVPLADGSWQATDNGQQYRMCDNYSAQNVCNWMVEANSSEAFCLSCRLDRTIPDLGVNDNRLRWQTLEIEKRRLVYSLLRLGLPLAPQSRDPAGLAFDFLADTPATFSEQGRVMTGHNNGVITLNISEADDVERERMRQQMAEPYRTILGHFRHESGHYYWHRLLGSGNNLDAFRTCFGDERLDYSQALEQHYQQGPAFDWESYYISAYASCHPWEDWAETWAHYLHIVDTLETAYSFGLRITPRRGDPALYSVEHDFNAYAQGDFPPLIEHWLPLTFALNSLNRSMGHRPSYPFVLAPAVVDKLAFVHRVVKNAQHAANVF